MAEGEDARLKELREQIAARLHHVCAHWPVDLFAEMVDGLAALTLRYDLVDQPPGYDPLAMDQVVAELKDAVARSEGRRTGAVQLEPNVKEPALEPE